MSHIHVGSRRLNLRAALGRTLRVLPMLWRGAAGALALCALVWLIPLIRTPTGALGWVWSGAAVLTSLIALGALARLSVVDTLAEARAHGLGPSGLQLRQEEWRLMGAALLCLLFLAMILSILSLVVLAVFGMAELNVQAIQARDWASVGAPWKLAVLAALTVGAVAIPLLLAVRLSLFVPATIGRRQRVSLNAMPIVRGAVSPILAGLVVTALPKIPLLILVGAGLLSGPAGRAIWVLGLVGLQLPLTIAFLGAVYRQLEDWTPDFPEESRR